MQANTASCSIQSFYSCCTRRIAWLIGFIVHFIHAIALYTTIAGDSADRDGALRRVLRHGVQERLHAALCVLFGGAFADPNHAAGAVK